MHVDEIDIGGVVEFLGSELPEGQHAEREGNRLAVPAAPARRPEALANTGLGDREGALENHVGQGRELAQGHRAPTQRDPLLTGVTDRDAREFEVLEAAQRERRVAPLVPRQRRLQTTRELAALARLIEGVVE